MHPPNPPHPVQPTPHQLLPLTGQGLGQPMHPAHMPGLVMQIHFRIRIAFANFEKTIALHRSMANSLVRIRIANLRFRICIANLRFRIRIAQLHSFFLEASMRDTVLVVWYCILVAI
jgi:hypothetical protein